MILLIMILRRYGYLLSSKEKVEECMSPTSIRVVLADDHPVVLDGLQNQIANVPHMKTVGTARSFDEALGVLAQTVADVLVLDLLGMGGSPIAMVSGLQHSHPHLKAIVFSSSIDMAPELLQAGARGYLTKEEMPNDMVDAIVTVHGGGVFLSRNVRSYLDQTARVSELTPQELLVLKLNAQGLGTSEIAEQMSLDPRTINNYFSLIRRKTGCVQRVQMADWYRRIYGSGQNSP
jgi:two-component system NarL family response regulator